MGSLLCICIFIFLGRINHIIKLKKKTNTNKRISFLVWWMSKKHLASALQRRKHNLEFKLKTLDSKKVTDRHTTNRAVLLNLTEK